MSGQVTQPHLDLKAPPPLPEGGKTLTFSISDHAGNETTERVTFTVVVPVPPPPPPPI